MKKTDKLVFTAKPPRLNDIMNCRVRITPSAAVIVNEIALKTGLSATTIVSTMIEFASSNVEIKAADEAERSYVESVSCKDKG